ncbi:MAG: SRPBCC family protein [Flavobacteriales bacterium]|nr:SRPBCC family protein [Flavobacteriales bacterium]
MLLYMLIGLVAVIGIILVAASTKPNTVHYERSIVIGTSADRIRPHITDFRKWGAWSPWEKKDPAMQREFSGADSGVGARYGWKGNNNVGEGGMAITQVTPEKVMIDMQFIKPWKAECLAEFHFTPQAGGTHVRWTMDGP